MTKSNVSIELGIGYDSTPRAVLAGGNHSFKHDGKYQSSEPKQQEDFFNSENMHLNKSGKSKKSGSLNFSLVKVSHDKSRKSLRKSSKSKSKKKLPPNLMFIRGAHKMP